MHNRYTHIKIWCPYQFSLWKRIFAWPYLCVNGQSVEWKLPHLSNAMTLVVWGSGKVTTSHAASHIVRMEDGFIHSLGLGSDLSPPCSQVLDTTGIYFDAQHNNDLFILLNTYVFDSPLIERAKKLRNLMVDTGVTKYNLGRQPCTWQRPQNQRVILVVGQVADDASVKLGSSGSVDTIDKLLIDVWQNNSDAFIVYKPHPDVLSGNRQGLSHAQHYCHIVDAKADIISIIEQVDEVHTLSSLAGFDALIRGKKVVTYGVPFYAGWGLTEDKIERIPFRERSVSLEALIAASLILYPIYWDWDLKAFTTPEATIKKMMPFLNRPIKKMTRSERLFMKSKRWCINLFKYILLRYVQRNQCNSV